MTSTDLTPTSSVSNDPGKPLNDASLRTFRSRDASLVLVGVLVGVGLSWLTSFAAEIQPRAVDRIAAEVRLEIAKNHPELLKDVSPFIDCAVVRQKSEGSLAMYLSDRSKLMGEFRSSVAFCAKEADDFLAKSPKPLDANVSAAGIALPSTPLAPSVVLPHIDATPAVAATLMPSLPSHLRPAPQTVAPPLATVSPGDQVPILSDTNEAPHVFSAEPTGSLGPVVPPLGTLGGLISTPPEQAALQVVKPPENQ